MKKIDNRENVSLELLKRCMESAENRKTGIAGIISNNSVCQVFKDKVVSYFKRDNICLIQTPQAYQFDLIYKAHESAYKDGMVEFTDDSQLVERFGESVYIVPGEETNIKITTSIDLEFAELLSDKVKD